MQSEEPETDHERCLSTFERRGKVLGDRNQTRRRLVRPISQRREQEDWSRQLVVVRQRRRTPFEELRQKSIEGRLTLSDYERELDRLERIDRGAGEPPAGRSPSEAGLEA